MAYPRITLKQCDYAQITQNKTGDLAMAYKPLQNLVKNTALGDFTTESLSFNRYDSQDLLIVDEFDGSTNIIINDDRNQPRLINSGFAVQEDNTFLIPEHYTNSVTNIYSNDTFDRDTQLLKLYNSIPSIKFLGLGDGAFKCGSYIFYFRLADSVGNMSNVIQHSSTVQVFIGENGSYQVRMGMQDENAGKSIKFKLTGIDSGFDYLRVFYERTSSGNDQASNTGFFMIDQNFPIVNGECTITLTGEENTLSITLQDLKNEYADISACKTQTVVDNVLFLANTEAYVHNYDELQRLAWCIYPSAVRVPVEMPDSKAEGTAKGYYDPLNVYNKVGYWHDEYYRFGIVFIYNNNQLSPVFNIQGYDMQCSTYGTSSLLDQLFNLDSGRYNLPDYEPEDYIFNDKIMSNSKGVVRTPLNNQMDAHLCIQFHMSGIDDFYIKYSSDLTDDEREYYRIPGTPVRYDISKFLNEKHGIKGFFFVRQKRIPTTLAQGIVVGLTTKEYGSIPILEDGENIWKSKSFLSKDRFILPVGSTIVTDNNGDQRVVTQALLVPDAELQEATFNQLFTSQEYALYYENSCQFSVSTDDNWWDYTNTYTRTIPDPTIVKLTAVPRDTKLLTNGTDFFSSIAGSPEEAFKTENIREIWNKTKPQDLTVSPYLIRGKWGYYVGMSQNPFKFGDVVSIKKSGFITNSESQNLLEFQTRFADHSFYSPLSTRYAVDSLDQITRFDEFGGDCFPSLFTHRMMSNFIDPELPTNTKIVNPGCWCENYAVRCTAEILQNTSSNLAGESAGFYIPSPNKSSVISLVFGILTGNLGTIINSISSMTKEESDYTGQEEFANEIAQAFEVYIGNQTSSYGVSDSGVPADPLSSGSPILDEDGNIKSTYETGGWDKAGNQNALAWAASKGNLKKVNPKEQEQNASGFNLKALFKSDDKWELHGIAQINRADVNAVSFGQWITFPIKSSLNLALRDVDFNQTTEEAKFSRKRSFYPLEKMDITNKMHESNVINAAAKKTVHKNTYPVYKTVPFVKQEYFNRIYWSKPNIADSFLNSYRMIYKDQYKEYSKEFGSITKILPVKNSLLVVFDHGIGIAPVDRTAKTESEATPYLASREVLPVQLTNISKDFGSMWKNSIIQTPKGIVYGVDTIAKKIWRTNGSNLEFISDHYITKFLNDHIQLSEFDFKSYQGHIDVKTHYNNFKNDVIFTFTKDVPKYLVPTKSKEQEIRSYMRLMWDIHRQSYVYFSEYKTGKTPGNGTMTVVYGEPTSIYDSSTKTNIKQTDTCCDGFTDVTLIPTGSSFYTKLEYPDKSSKTLSTEYKTATLEIQEGKVYLNDIYTGVQLDVEKWEPGVVWSLCYNEVLQKWITFYDWYPIESCNVNNIYFSFDQDSIDGVFKNTPKCWYPNITKTETMPINKYFIDKTFTDSANQYRFTSGETLSIYDLYPNNDIIDIVTQPAYMSFYYKGNTVPVIGSKAPKYTSDAFTQDGWKFVIFELTNTINDRTKAASLIMNMTNWRIQFASDTDIIELKVFNLPKGLDWSEYIQAQMREKPHLQFIELRDFNSNRMFLWKHGQSGIYDNQGKILPTNWYGKQHEFNFEFVVNDTPIKQKIFNNLKLISNKTKPRKLEYEIVGEGYEWWLYKPVIFWANENSGIGKPFTDLYSAYQYILSNTTDVIRGTYADFPETDLEYRAQLSNNPYQYIKLPYLKIELTDRKGRKDRSYNVLDAWSPYKPSMDQLPRVYDYTFNTNETCIKYDEQLNEYRIHDEQLGNDMQKYGRVRGNMQYLEDLWDIEIRPINFKWIYKDTTERGLEFRQAGSFTPMINTVKDKIYNFVVHTSGPSTITITEVTNTGKKGSQNYPLTVGGNTITYQAKENDSYLIFNVQTQGRVRFPRNQGDNNLLYYLSKNQTESRHRDKYIKIKIRYSGEDLAIVQQIYTIFDESYA